MLAAGARQAAVAHARDSMSDTFDNSTEWCLRAYRCVQTVGIRTATKVL